MQPSSLEPDSIQTVVFHWWQKKQSQRPREKVASDTVQHAYLQVIILKYVIVIFLSRSVNKDVNQRS